MKKPTTSKSAPSGPSTAASGGGSIRDRNVRGAARDDSSRRAAATEGEESDEGGGIGAGGVAIAGEAEPVDAVQEGTYDAKADKGKPQDYVVVDGGTIDDGKHGSKFKVCKAGDVVQLTPARAAHFQKHGVPLVEKKEHEDRKKRAAA